MALFDVGTNFGFWLAIIGLFLWVIGEVLPKLETHLSSLGGLATVGKPVFFIGIVLGILLLIF